MFKEELLQYRDSAVEHQFATLREIKAGKCDFNEFTITDMGPKGRGIMLKKPKRGLLIPYGGRLVASEQSEANCLKSKYEIRRNYLIRGVDDEVCWDACPKMVPQSMVDCWPGAFINEATAGSDELYNCIFVYINSNDYGHMPEYPGVLKHTQMVFVEVMVSKKCDVEALVHYGRSHPVASGRRMNCGYEEKPLIPDNLALNFGIHWRKSKAGNLKYVALLDEIEDNESLEVQKREKESKRLVKKRRVNHMLAHDPERNMNNAGRVNPPRNWHYRKRAKKSTGRIIKSIQFGKGEC